MRKETPLIDTTSHLLPWLLSLVLLPLGMAAPVRAAERTLTLDPAASEVTFTLGATMHTVKGSFAVSEGVVRFDPATGQASGEVVVDLTSGDTGNDKRDRDMHRKVLESDRYPRAVFTPTRVEGDVGGGEVILHGRLELHGASHEVAIPARVSVQGGRVEATGSFRVPYVDWGMEDPSTFLLRVDEHVDVTVRAVGTLE